MLPLQFFGQNLHFALSLFAALVFFAVFWLEFDAWLLQHKLKELVKWLGFLLLALSFVASATYIARSGASVTTLNKLTDYLSQTLRLLGFAGIIAGQLLDPLQEVPDLPGLNKTDYTDKPKKRRPKALSSVLGSGLSGTANLLAPLGALAICVLYRRRATIGLERHYKPVALAFGFLSLYEGLSLSSLWQTSSNPVIARLVAPYASLWLISQLVLLTATIILGTWVWRYLTRRFLSQLFMIFTAVTLSIFLLTTVSFTFLLVRNIQTNALNNLQTAAGVLHYAVDSKQAETIAKTQAIAENSAIASAVSAGDHKGLLALAGNYLVDNKLTSLTITNASGQVLLRAEDPDRFGDSLSSDTLLRRSLVGHASSSISSRDGVLAPLVLIKSSVPIRDASHTIVGTANTSLALDNSFVDGIKQATGLDSAIYAGNIRSATTFLAPDGQSRWIGVKETNRAVQRTVLQQHRTFKGPLSIQNRQFLAVYTPLKDVDGTNVGMLFIGQPQSAVLEAARHSIELTFIVTAFLLLVSIWPAYLMARYIEKQLS